MSNVIKMPGVQIVCPGDVCFLPEKSPLRRRLLSWMVGAKAGNYIRISDEAEKDEVLKALCDVDFRRNNTPRLRTEDLFREDKGLWDIVGSLDLSNTHLVVLDKLDLVARSAIADIVEGGVVSIDFGTKSTVVACSQPGVSDQIIRIGAFDLRSEVKAEQFENATAIEFGDVARFLADYKSRPGRPYTKVNDLLIGPSAQSAMLADNSGEHRSRFFDGLKQWAQSWITSVSVRDRSGAQFDIAPYNSLRADGEHKMLDPIECYAYYIGLSINNQLQNRIFLKYILSCPVSFPEKLVMRFEESFRRGLKKSIPSLVQEHKCFKEFSVAVRWREPFAYAVCALQEYKLRPEKGRGIHYGVFDFGGGTTDFDFGIWRNPEDENSGQYAKELVHKAAGGDSLLGGERLLECAAYDVFVRNIDEFRKNLYPIACPEERQNQQRLGCELLISDTIYARNNLRRIAEALRPIWENTSQKQEIDDHKTIEVMLQDRDGKAHMKVVLSVDVKTVDEMFSARIRRAVEDFGLILSRTFAENINEKTEIHVFMAGNASRSHHVKDAFRNLVTRWEEKGWKMKIHAWGTENPSQTHLFTAKTGVALGLLRLGDGDILVKDQVKEAEEPPFPYYVCRDDGMRILAPLKDEEGVFEPGVLYGRLFHLMAAGRSSVKLYYTRSPRVEHEEVAVDSQGVKSVHVKFPEFEKPVSCFKICATAHDRLEIKAYHVGENDDSLTIGKPMEIILK